MTIKEKRITNGRVNASQIKFSILLTKCTRLTEEMGDPVWSRGFNQPKSCPKLCSVTAWHYAWHRYAECYQSVQHPTRPTCCMYLKSINYYTTTILLKKNKAANYRVMLRLLQNLQVLPLSIISATCPNVTHGKRAVIRAEMEQIKISSNVEKCPLT